jgi:hypothetical protein
MIAFIVGVSPVKRIPHKYPNATPKNENNENMIVGTFGIE